jgi:predicted Fe-S protein YdhL (DUF1289 family)
MSPCKKICKLNDQNICIGCGRTLEDITKWTRLSELERNERTERANQRMLDMRVSLQPPTG